MRSRTYVLVAVNDNAQKHENELIDKKEYLRPGFSRFSPYFMRTHQVDTSSCDHQNCSVRLRLLPLYKFIPDREFKHNSRVTSFKDRLWLSHIFKDNGGNSQDQSKMSRRALADGGVAYRFPGHFQER